MQTSLALHVLNSHLHHLDKLWITTLAPTNLAAIAGEAEDEGAYAPSYDGVARETGGTAHVVVA